jgi:hypothetical protein
VCDSSDVNSQKSASCKSHKESTHGVLGDNTRRDYSRKLRLFNTFAEPELREAIAREFALHRPDFHFLQTLTLVTGRYA